MCVLHELPGHPSQQFLLHLQHRFPGCDPGAVADPEDVGVDRHGGTPEGGIEHHVGGLAPYPRQFFQGLSVIRNLAPVAFLEDAAGLQDILCLLRRGVIPTICA